MLRFAAPSERLSLLVAILDWYPGPIYAKDASGLIVFCNGPAAALFGRAAVPSAVSVVTSRPSRSQ